MHMQSQTRELAPEKTALAREDVDLRDPFRNTLLVEETCAATLRLQKQNKARLSTSSRIGRAGSSDLACRLELAHY